MSFRHISPAALFRQVSGTRHTHSSPTISYTTHLTRLFNRYSGVSDPGFGSQSLSEQVQQLTEEISQQRTVVSEIASTISSPGKAVQNLASGNLFGSSLFGDIVGSASSGLSWHSILNDVFPIGGLISGIASLFGSAPTPPPLIQYDAPPSLNFSGVLGPNGTISQASYDASGNSRAASPGLDLADAEGGLQSPYKRAADGSLVATGGDATARYAGILDLSSAVRSLVNEPGSAAPDAAPGNGSSSFGNPASRPTQPPVQLSAELQATLQQLPQVGNIPDPNSDATQQAPELPAFDGPWFMDRASHIAAAVRSAMLDYHPVVDVVNDL